MKQLLVVEDHSDTLAVMSRLLVRHGHRVTGVPTVAEATRAAAGGAFDLAIVDIGLPDSDGCDLMRHLRQVHGLGGLAMTGYGMEADVERCRAAGFRRRSPST